MTDVNLTALEQAVANMLRMRQVELLEIKLIVLAKTWGTRSSELATRCGASLSLLFILFVTYLYHFQLPTALPPGCCQWVTG